MKGSITISRYFNTDTVSIQFEDGLSGTRFLNAEMPLKDFASALMGMGNVACNFELFADRVGKKYEWKKEIVFMPDCPYDKRDEVAAQACLPHEVDGWIADYKDCLNHHRMVRGSSTKEGAKYEVIFRRWVDVAAKS